ncbi:outer membrane receptor protein involved in Fe transport [Mucilaginibacter frigoritolerans]|uniref:Outer membrane receptor protein involved in Fe transport n=1 Tax=Mucilaginibacter frigoritolerans TaxID=652788 RepID=A0A562UFI7_9SPHI|nr:TonB-dependent receptor [Mucilaginibacter frigoritolerans]TWJ04349.1 outer membrane receptor protein involved in Fe transport [Mucilaginibacter frigoritolerans]
MRLIIVCFFVALMACLCNNLYGQEKSAGIQGKVLINSQLPAESSTVILLNYNDSSIVKSTLVNKEGLYKFSNLEPGDYLLMVTKVGYSNAYSRQYKLIADQIITADDVIISPATQQLKEVSVTASRPPVEVQPGKIILNIQSSIIATGSSALDILRQSPGVRVDNNNSINIIGRQNALITINGKPTNLTGEDLATILRSIPASTIDRIELITAGSVKYDASSGGIINIVTKKGNNYGENVTVSASAGYGRYYKASTGIVFNDRTDKFNIFGNYNFSSNKTFHDFSNDRIIDFDNLQSEYNVAYSSVQTNNNNSFGFGTDYYVSKNNTIGFLVSGSFVGVDLTKNDNLKIYNQAVFDSTITAMSDVSRNIRRLNYNVNYNGKLGSGGQTLTANFDYNTYNRSSTEHVTNNFYNTDGSKYSDSLQQRILSPSNIHIWLSKIDFTDPLSKTSKLEAGIKYSNVTSNNDLLFYRQTGNGPYIEDASFTNHFMYTENVNAAYINYENNIDKLSIDAGLRVEQTISKGNSVTLNQTVDNKYTDLFPHVLLSYTITDKKEISLSFNRGITRPGYELLNPFLYYVDLYDYHSGNPYLKPEYSNSIELSYTYNKTIVATLYSNVISDAYELNFYEQNDTSKVNINTNRNFGRIENFGIRFFAPVTFTTWWNANFNLDAAYQRYISYPQNGYLNKGTQDVVLKTTQYFIIGNDFTAELSGRYETPSYYGLNQYKSYYNVDAGISKKLFNKNGSIRFAMVDIFNTIRDRSRTNYENLNMTGVDKRESQIATLTFTYRFGKMLKSISHHTGNEEEVRRTNSTN